MVIYTVECPTYRAATCYVESTFDLDCLYVTAAIRNGNDDIPRL
jgi:hypothetical protein